jgi:hypothetical protein
MADAADPRRGGASALYPGAALRAAVDVLGVRWDSVRVLPGGDIELLPPAGAAIRIPVDGDGLTPIGFAGGLTAFPVSLSYRQILEADAHPGAGAVDLSAVKDRVVIVGVTFAGNADLQPTPFSTAYPMFLVQATMIDNILRGRFPPSGPGLVRCRRRLPAARLGPRRVHVRLPAIAASRSRRSPGAAMRREG